MRESHISELSFLHLLCMFTSFRSVLNHTVSLVARPKYRHILKKSMSAGLAALMMMTNVIPSALMIAGISSLIPQAEAKFVQNDSAGTFVLDFL